MTMIRFFAKIVRLQILFGSFSGDICSFFFVRKAEVTKVNEVLRQEKKYLMTLQNVKSLSGKLSQVLMEDEHNGANGYSIRSLYFDTPYDDDFYD